MDNKIALTVTFYALRIGNLLGFTCVIMYLFPINECVLVVKTVKPLKLLTKAGGLNPAYIGGERLWFPLVL